MPILAGPGVYRRAQDATTAPESPTYHFDVDEAVSHPDEVDASRRGYTLSHEHRYLRRILNKTPFPVK
jgi:hypothetical protein